MIMSKFKVGDKVRVLIGDTAYGLYEGTVHTVVSVHPMGNIGLQGKSVIQWSPNRFELVQDAVLTPEEVFAHLRKGTKLQLQNSHSGHWYDVIATQYVSYEEITTKQWRIKPKPEVIELNGKKYQEIVE